MPTAEITVPCVRCGRSIETTEVVLYGHTFPANRFCDLCREGERAHRDQEEVEQRWSRTLVPRLYLDATFETFEPVAGAAPALGRARRWSAEYRAGTRLHQGLMFTGPPGAGKTHLAVALLREAVYGSGARCLFMNLPEWLNSLRQSFADGSEAPVSPEGYEVVVLDDLGAELSSDWARDRIYTIVNHREQRGLVTHITTNASPAELRQRLGTATASRIARLCATVELTAPDYRESLAAAASNSTA